MRTVIGARTARGSWVVAGVLVLAGLSAPAAAAVSGGCRYRVVHVRTVLNVRALPSRGARVVARLGPGARARGSCGRVWSDGRTWIALDAPGGYAAAHYLRRA